MIKDPGMKIKFLRLDQGILDDTFQLIQGDVIMLDQEDNIIKVGVVTAIDLAQGNAVWVCNGYLQISEPTNVDVALRSPLGQGNEPFKGNRFGGDL